MKKKQNQRETRQHNSRWRPEVHDVHRSRRRRRRRRPIPTSPVAGSIRNWPLNRAVCPPAHQLPSTCSAAKRCLLLLLVHLHLLVFLFFYLYCIDQVGTDVVNWNPRRTRAWGGYPPGGGVATPTGGCRAVIPPPGKIRGSRPPKRTTWPAPVDWN